MKQIRWIFFDVGSTLVDEEEAYRHRVRDMIRGTPVTVEQYYEKRVQFAKAGYNGDQKAIDYFGLTKTPWHSEDETPFVDCPRPCKRCEIKDISLASLLIRNPGRRRGSTGGAWAASSP